MVRPACVSAVFFLPVLGLASSFQSVRDHGAKGDGIASDTQAIQAAIDAAGKQGGGTVLLPPGKYLCAAVRLKSNITIEISSGATLLAGPDAGLAAVISGEGLQDVAVRGAGAIDGNRAVKGRPKPIALVRCERVSIRGVTIRNAPGDAVSLIGCDGVDVDGVNIIDGFAGGIVPDGSKFVRISNCYVDTQDAAVWLKSSEHRPAEHITVATCVLRTNSDNFKLGPEGQGGFRNIAATNLVMLKRDTGRRPVSGIAIESVDGAGIEGVAISNITMTDVGTPLFVRLGNRGQGTPGYARDISVTSVVAAGTAVASSVTGLARHPVRNVSLSDFNIVIEGGGSFAGIGVPELESGDPRTTMFGKLPAHSLYARHVDGLTLRNFKTRWLKADRRPAFVLDDVADAVLNGLRAGTFAGPEPFILLHHVSGALVTGCRVGQEIPLFLRASGSRTRNVTVLGNDLHLVKRAVDVTSGADYHSVVFAGNLAPGKTPAID